MLLNKWFERLDEIYGELVSWRRHLHQHPELSFHEKKTALFVADKLRNWGFDVRENVGGGGVVARIKGEGSGPTVALRADIDALPIQDEKACEYASLVPGVMHACGHDGHTATLLGVAKVISERRAELPGEIVLLFQHAEEVSPGGAAPMIADGALEDVDAIYGVHLWSLLPYGTISSLEGPIMAATDELKIEIRGRGGHGGMPHQTIDAIAIGAHLVVNLQSIVSRNVDPTESCVISIGSIKAGTGFNVIAEKAFLSGTVRTFNREVQDLVRRRIEEVVAATCRMFQADYHLEYKQGYPAVVNDPREVSRFFTVGPQVVPESQVQEMPKVMVAEDFAYYLQQVPGCFMFVGAGNADQGIIYPHHHPKFDFDERAMLHSGKLLMAMAWDRLSSGN